MWALGSGSAKADEGKAPAYDISWPQCENGAPHGEFHFAVIGLNNGRPFTTNDCFKPQYAWAASVQAHPAVYINLDFPKAERPAADNGPYGRCAAEDGWCRGYNWGYALARDSVSRARSFGITPERYWLDVEMANHWSETARDNGQVVRGAVDYFVEHGIPVGVYGTRYQWQLITGGYAPSDVTLPLWVAGAEDATEAEARCSDRSFAFAGGNTWMVQYPEGEFDGNVLCDIAPRVTPAAPAKAPAPIATVVPQPSPTTVRPGATWPEAATNNPSTVTQSLHERIRQVLNSRVP